MHWPLTDVSIASAITSRDTSEYFMPSVPMPMPSVTVGTPNTCGIAPASFSAAIARSTSGWMPALHGIHRAVAVGDADDRLVEIAVAESDGAQHRAIGRAGDALRDELGAAVVRHGRTPGEASDLLWPGFRREVVRKVRRGAAYNRSAQF